MVEDESWLEMPASFAAMVRRFTVYAARLVHHPHPLFDYRFKGEQYVHDRRRATRMPPAVRWKRLGICGSERGKVGFVLDSDLAQ